MELALDEGRCGGWRWATQSVWGASTAGKGLWGKEADYKRSWCSLRWMGAGWRCGPQSVWALGCEHSGECGRGSETREPITNVELALVSERFTIWSHLIWLAIFWNECGRCRASRSDRRLLLRLRVRGRWRVAWRVAGSGRVLDLVALLLHRADLAAADMGGDRCSASRARARVPGRSRAFGRGGGHSVVT